MGRANREGLRRRLRSLAGGGGVLLGLAALGVLAAWAAWRPLAAQAPERAGFVVLRGADTLAAERFERSATALTGTLIDRTAGVREAYVAQLRPDASVSSLEVRAWLATAADSAPPLQHATIAFEGDTAVLTPAGGGAGQRFGTRPGVVPYLNLSGAILEQIVRRARALHADSVPIFAQNGATLNVGVSAATGDTVAVALPGAGGHVQILLVVDGMGRILGGSVPAQGLRIVRAADVRMAPPPKPDYSAPAGAPYTAEEVTVPGPAGKLVGTLTLPKRHTGRLPAVVTITGSGPEDRDESLGAVAPGYRPFRQVADTLSRRGIAVLRLDDRGTGESTGSFRGATSADFARDIEAAVAWLRQRPDIDPARIALVGHSEGGIIAPMVAAADPRIRAIALMAGTAYTGRKVLRFQFGYALQRDSALSGARLDSAVDRMLARTDSARDPWMHYFLDYDPLVTARKVRTPVLILQGGVDKQVTPEQAGLLAQAFRAGGDRDVTVHVFPGRNHLFLRDATGNPANYPKLASYVIDPEVMGTLADWMVRELGARGETPARRPR